MILKAWEELPEELKLPEVRPYYDILAQKKNSLYIKRAFDASVSGAMLLALTPAFLGIALAIKLDSEGPVFYRQERITQYNKPFKIFKFRSMVQNADQKGSLVTVNNDSRVTGVGQVIRKYRLDEISQLIDVFRGEMTFVGTRPEVKKYVERYTPEMMATLLLPAGVTSLASIFYKDEAELLDASADPDKTYTEEILPEKMKYNLQAIREFSFFGDIKIMLMTVLAVLGKEFSEK